MKNIKFMMLTKIPGNFLQNIPNESININNIQYMFINIYTSIITPDQRIHKINLKSTSHDFNAQNISIEIKIFVNTNFPYPAIFNLRHHIIYHYVTVFASFVIH